MDIKIFKAFHTYLMDTLPTLGNLHKLQDHCTVDPEGSQWRTLGFAPVTINADSEDAEFAMDVQGAGILCVAQLNERILPGAVHREKMIERIAQITAREGRKPGKKEYAEIRDEVAQDLLPKSHIRRKLVPVLFAHGRMLVFTSSAKLCDDVVTLVGRALHGEMEAVRMRALGGSVKADIDSRLTEIAWDGVSDSDESYAYLQAMDSAVLKGDDKQVIRIKGKDVGSADVHGLLQQGYQVTQLGLELVDGSDIAVTFSLNSHLVVTGFTLPDAKNKVRGKDEKDAADTFLATAWLVAQATHSALDVITNTMGGITPAGETGTPVAAPAGPSAAHTGEDEL